MTDVPVFFTAPDGRERVSLRRYAEERVAGSCPHQDSWGYHDAETFLGVFNSHVAEKFESGRGYVVKAREVAHYDADPRWPKRCRCGYEFRLGDHWQVFTDQVLVRTDGKPGEFSRRTPLIGQMWDCYWLPDHYVGSDGQQGWTNVGPDGLALCVCVPGKGRKSLGTHDWMPEQRCHNCGSPKDDQHLCWIRHGDARRNECHVDKAGKTCSAGAGSIQTDGWHGFVQRNFVVGVPPGVPTA